MYLKEKKWVDLAKTYDELISIIKDEKLITDISKIDNYDLLVNYFIKILIYIDSN